MSSASTDTTSATSASSAAPSSAGATSAAGPLLPQVIVKKWNAVAFAVRKQETCGICRNDLELPCITCQGKDAKEDCQKATGTCGHELHFHCISTWLQKQQTCPYDAQPWSFKSN